MAVEVIALVGASGTGKSHRASLIAREENIDLVIDDGLLLRDGKILTGASAKKAETRLGAIRIAIFADPAQAREARAKIRELKPGRILILGTSRNMVHRISDALDLPRPDRYISIEEVASPVEIRRALRIRREQGKHVIPAPTLEVKKAFSGYLIDPLRLRFFRRGRSDRDLVFEKSVVRPTFSSYGRFFIADTVLATIAARALRTSDGVTRVLRVTVGSKTDGVEVQAELVLRYGVFIPGVLVAAQKQVKDVLEHMTALNVLAVNLVARRLTFEKEETGDRGSNIVGPEDSQFDSRHSDQGAGSIAREL